MAKRRGKKAGRRARRRRRLIAICAAVVCAIFGVSFLVYLLFLRPGEPATVRETQEETTQAGAGEGGMPFATYGNLQEEDDAGSGEARSAEEEAPEAETEQKDEAEVTMLRDVQEKLASMTLEEKIAQLFIITPEQLTGYQQVTQCGEATYSAFRNRPVGGLIYFASNLETYDQTYQLVHAAKEYALETTGIPLFTAIDEEGGRVTRAALKLYDIPQTPPMAQVAQGGETAVREAGETIGEYLNRLGFNLDFAPDADVLTNPSNIAIGDRSFGSDPAEVARMADAFTKGLAAHGVIGCYKHFPGHGGTTADTHDGYAYVDKDLDALKETELVPFADGIAKDVPMIMVAHVSLPALTGSDIPATLSEEIVTGLLRNDLGYDGVVITDALGMGAVAGHYSARDSALMALQAGCDILLMPSDFESAYQAVLGAVQNGTVPEERIDASVTRILLLKQRLPDSF